MNFYDQIYKNSSEEELYEFLDIIDSKNLFKEIRKTKNKNILEIGSGTDRIIEKIDKCNPKKLVATETSKEAIKILKKKFKSLVIKKSSDTISDKFDYILIIHTLLHIKNKKRFLKDIKRLLDSNGKIVLSLLTQRKPVVIIDRSGRKIKQEIYPNKIMELRRIAKELNFSIEVLEKVRIDRDRLKYFDKRDFNKLLSYYLVLAVN